MIFAEASSFPSKVTTSALWESHQRINEILEQLIPIESGKKPSSKFYCIVFKKFAVINWLTVVF